MRDFCLVKPAIIAYYQVFMEIFLGDNTAN